MKRPTDDIVVHSLKQRYFALVSQENYPHTPDITRQCDQLEVAIRNLQKSAAADKPTR